MSERTTIGGTVYEAIGSSSSNLLLKCNGTARIQWGNRLIDLIKNGKIASEDSQELIFIVSDESEIKSDGIYVLTTDESFQLWICKDGNKYDFTGTELYISASKEQNLTVEQKKQALDNIGFQYDTYDELVQAKLQNGIVYVLETKTLYTIKDGVIEEFEAKLKSVTVEQGAVDGEVINSSTKIVLSILDDEYLILADQRITANYSIHVKESAQIGSESADKTQGYRLYIDGGTSWLDVDEINVRNGIKVKQYKEVVFEDFLNLIKQASLEPHVWYLITNYQNPWKLTVNNDEFNRPILVRALTENTLYEKGYLFRDHRIIIHYDYTYQETIKQKSIVDGVEQETNVSARGLITWMKDPFNNEANFDFLDYTDSNNQELATLHYPNGIEGEEKSIFPKHSYNNKLKAINLKGITLKDGIFNNDYTFIVDFKFDDSTEAVMEMHDNDIECLGLILQPTCSKFSNNTLQKSIKLEISNDFIGNNFASIYTHVNNTHLDFETTTFESIIDPTIFNNVLFQYQTENNVIDDSRHCLFQEKMHGCHLGYIENCVFNGYLKNTNIGKFTRPSYEYQLVLPSMENTTIEEIFGDNNILSTITDSYIKLITNVTELKNSNLTGCSIQELKHVIVEGYLQNSVFGNVEESTFSGNISDSVMGDLSNVTLSSKSSIEKSTFLNIKNTTVDSSIVECIFGNIEDFTINNSITDSKFGNINNNSVINNPINKCNFLNVSSSVISGDLTNNTFKDVLQSTINGTIINSNFDTISGNSEISGSILDSNFGIINDSKIFGDITEGDFLNITTQSTLNASFSKVNFKNLTSCTFDVGTIAETVSFYDLSNTGFNDVDYNLLYNVSKRKEIYIHNEKIQVISVPDVVFYRGMIIMHYIPDQIPLGWALCDGGEYTWNGVTTKTPDLRNRFIKAAETLNSPLKESEENTDLNENKKLQLKKEHLPEHNHPHKEHNHELDSLSITMDPSGDLGLESQDTFAQNHSDTSVISSVDISGDGVSASASSVDVLYSTTWRAVYVEGGNHSHNITVNGGDIKSSKSEEDTQTWENKEINIEPEHYTLIFIMKL